jgi:hypothetical protein
MGTNSPGDTALQTHDQKRGARAMNESETANATDSDTETKTEPKDGLRGRAKPTRLDGGGDSGGGSDTGGGGGPKTGLTAEPSGQPSKDPSPDPKKPPKTGVGAEPRHGIKSGLGPTTFPEDSSGS